MSALSALGASPPFLSPTMAQATIAASPSSANSKLGSIMQRVLDEKQRLTQQASDKRFVSTENIVGEAAMIGGDAFSMGYLAFEGVKALLPATQSIPTIVIATAICGVLGGLINILVSFVCLKGAIQDFRNGNIERGIRQFLDFAGLFLIGWVMILTSVTTHGALVAFFSQPWVMPLLFFAITVPLLLELIKAEISIGMKWDLASKMNVDELEKQLQSGAVNWDQMLAFSKEFYAFLNQERDERKIIDLLSKKKEDLVADLGTTAASKASKLQLDLIELEKVGTPDAIENFKVQIFQWYKSIKTDKKIIDTLSKKMEEMVADMGTTAALEAFKLQLALVRHDKEGALEAIKNFKVQISQWHKAIHVRFFQQILYVLSFGISMAITFRPQINTPMANASQNFVMAAANAVPLYMDTFWPFKRNTPIVVPLVETEGCLNIPNIPIAAIGAPAPTPVPTLPVNIVALPPPPPPLMQQYAQSAPLQSNPVRWQEKVVAVASVAAFAYLGYFNANSFLSAASAMGNLAQMGLSYIPGL